MGGMATNLGSVSLHCSVLIYTGEVYSIPKGNTTPDGVSTMIDTNLVNYVASRFEVVLASKWKKGAESHKANLRKNHLYCRSS